MTTHNNAHGEGPAHAGPNPFNAADVISLVERAGIYIGVTVWPNGNRQLWARFPIGRLEKTPALPSLTAAEIEAIAETLVEQGKALLMPQRYAADPGKEP